MPMYCSKYPSFPSLNKLVKLHVFAASWKCFSWRVKTHVNHWPFLANPLHPLCDCSKLNNARVREGYFEPASGSQTKHPFMSNAKINWLKCSVRPLVSDNK